MATDLFAGAREPSTVVVEDFYTTCPCHDDEHPSLHVTVYEDRALVFCQPCGAKGGDVVEALGLEPSALFARNGDRPAVLEHLPEERTGKVSNGPPRSADDWESEWPGWTATYDYVDVDGVLRYQVLRFDTPKGKQVVQRHPNPDEPGRWLAGRNGEATLLYRLDEVRRGGLVLVVEGEKCVEVLRAWDLTATTSGGASSWRTELAEHLAGAQVVVLPDADEAGRRYAQEVAADTGGLVVELPGLAEGEDVADWAAKGGTREALLELIQKRGEAVGFSSRVPAASPETREEAAMEKDDIRVVTDEEYQAALKRRAAKKAARRAAKVIRPKSEVEFRAKLAELGIGFEKAGSRITAQSANIIVATEPEGADAIVDGFLYRGTVTSLGGYLGAGKTPFTLRLVRAILAGEPTFLGFAVEKVPDEFAVVYLTQEPPRLFRNALIAAGFGPKLAERLSVVHWDANFDFLDERGGWEQMVREVTDMLGGRGLVVVDTPNDFATGLGSGVGDGGENDSIAMKKVYRPLVGAAGAGLTVWANVHTVKTFDSWVDNDADITAIRGSGEVAAHSAVVLLYKKPKASALRANTRFLKLGRTKQDSWPGGDSFYVSLDPTGRWLNREDSPATQMASLGEEDDDEAVLEAVRELTERDDRATRDAILMATGRQRQKMVDAIRRLYEAGTLIRTGSGKKGDPHVYLEAE